MPCRWMSSKSSAAGAASSTGTVLLKGKKGLGAGFCDCPVPRCDSFLQ